MLIRVVRAVNDFILSASFSDKTLRGGVRRGWPRRFFVKRGDAGKGRTLYAVLSISRSGFGLRSKEVVALGLAFSALFL
jgi:hypothetical protein